MKIHFLLIAILAFINYSFSQEKNDKLGVFVSPTIGLDFEFSQDNAGWGSNFQDDNLPLFGITYEHPLEKYIYAVKLGVEPIFSWHSDYGYSLDAVNQIVIGKNKFKFAFGPAYMYRKKYLFTQHCVYLSMAPSLTLCEHLIIEPSLCAGYIFEDDNQYIGYGGWYPRIWCRLNIVYLF